MNNSVNNSVKNTVMDAKAFMAFGQVSEVKETSFKRYIGVAPVNVVAVNPTKAELETIYGTTLNNELSYVSDIERNGKTIKQAKIDFIIKSITEECPFTTKMTFFINDAYMYNKDNTKVKVIDKYGRTAWVTIEEGKNHEIPMYKNGPAKIDKGYRPMYIGEEELTRFMKTYLNIPGVMRPLNDNEWVMVDDPEKCVCRLDSIASYFKEDVKEIKDAIALLPNCIIKVLLGVKTTDDGKQYQAVYTQSILKKNVTKYGDLEKEIKDRKEAGALATTEFEFCDVKEYSVEATTFNTPSTAAPAPADPFSTPTNTPANGGSESTGWDPNNAPF